MVLEAQPVSAGRARDFVTRLLVAHGLPHLVDNVCLVASELATNAVIHAQTQFTVRLSCVDGSVILSVRDGSTARVIRTEPHLLATSGRGLLLVDLLTHDWGTHADDHGWKTVWASFPSDPR
jgi:anti-sigma regulatory factor (Ser/Thr protein kinase)